MFNHKHQNATDCYEIAYFTLLQQKFTTLLQELNNHETETLDCSYKPHPGIDCYVARLEKLHAKIEKYLWHDLQLCSKSCTAKNHTMMNEISPLYPVLM